MLANIKLNFVSAIYVLSFINLINADDNGSPNNDGGVNNGLSNQQSWMDRLNQSISQLQKQMSDSFPIDTSDSNNPSSSSSNLDGLFNNIPTQGDSSEGTSTPPTAPPTTSSQSSPKSSSDTPSTNDSNDTTRQSPQDTPSNTQSSTSSDTPVTSSNGSVNNQQTSQSDTPAPIAASSSSSSSSSNSPSVSAASSTQVVPVPASSSTQVVPAPASSSTQVVPAPASSSTQVVPAPASSSTVNSSAQAPASSSTDAAVAPTTDASTNSPVAPGSSIISSSAVNPVSSNVETETGTGSPTNAATTGDPVTSAPAASGSPTSAGTDSSMVSPTESVIDTTDSPVTTPGSTIVQPGSNSTIPVDSTVLVSPTDSVIDTTSSVSSSSTSDPIVTSPSVSSIETGDSTVPTTIVTSEDHASSVLPSQSSLINSESETYIPPTVSLGSVFITDSESEIYTTPTVPLSSGFITDIEEPITDSEFGFTTDIQIPIESVHVTVSSTGLSSAVPPAGSETISIVSPIESLDQEIDPESVLPIESISPSANSFLTLTSQAAQETQGQQSTDTSLYTTSQFEPKPVETPTPTETTETSNNLLPTVLVTAATATDATGTLANSDIVQATGTAAASGLPRAITPLAPVKPAPDYQIITIGFKAPLNYPFVVKNSISSAQVFQFLPEVLKFPFLANGDSSNYKHVSVSRLIPFTSSQVSYTITVAEVYFPSASIAALSNLIITPQSLIYRNSDSTQNTLASLIDARVALVGLSTNNIGSDNRGGSSGSNQEASAFAKYHGSMDSEANAAAERNQNISSGTIAGIAVGAASGCAIYLSLMLYLFKRYRNNSGGGNIELESTDSESGFGMSETDSRGSRSSSGFTILLHRLSGAGTTSTDSSPRGNISEPVNASNSLGWYH